MKRIALLICFAVCLFSLLIATVFAHPGRTDNKGGHTDHSTGEYHYHHGYSAHDHYDMDGDGVVDCPYDFDDKTDHSSRESVTVKPKTSQTVPTTQPTTAPTTIPADNETQTPEQRSIGDIIVEIICIAFALLFWAYGSFVISVPISSAICNIIVMRKSVENILWCALFAICFVVGAIIIIFKIVSC